MLPLSEITVARICDVFSQSSFATSGMPLIISVSLSCRLVLLSIFSASSSTCLLKLADISDVISYLIFLFSVSRKSTLSIRLLIVFVFLSNKFSSAVIVFEFVTAWVSISTTLVSMSLIFYISSSLTPLMSDSIVHFRSPS